MYDLIIKNARVIDPETKLDEMLSVGVQDGIIREISASMAEDSPVIIDGEGCILAPGFIDIHAHEDVLPLTGEKVLPVETARAAMQEGVTTLVTGNCGVSALSAWLYRIQLAKSGIKINTPYFVGNIILRCLTGLGFNKKAGSARIWLMTILERMAFRHGAIGISFGLQYAPGTSYEEIVALAGVAAKKGKLMSVHMRSDRGEEAVKAVKEVIDAAEETGVSLEISHLASTVYGNDSIERASMMIENSSADISCDMYPYNVWATEIGAGLFDDELVQYNFGLSDVEVITGKYAGMRLNKEIFDDLRKNAPKTLVACHNAMPIEDVKRAYKLPYCMFGSDSQLCRNKDGRYLGHPRSSSAVVKFLCDFVRDSNTVSLMDGIAKLTILPAKKLGLENKGRIQVGKDADIVLFKLDELKVNATFGVDACAVPPSGIKYVFVKGKEVFKG